MIKIPIYKPCIGDAEKKLVNEALDDGWISSKGKFIEEFENKFAKYVNRKHAISAVNGTAALHMAIESLNLPKNSAIICPTLTYVASANSIRHAGLIPLFVDCNEFGLSEADQIKIGLEFANSNNINVSAIMPVHLYGNCCNINEIKEFGIPIIEDCAESAGSTIDGKVSGSHDTEFACFSFFGNKTITTGEGGMVVSNNDELAIKCKMFRNVGQNPTSQQRYQHLIAGHNYRLTNIASAIGIAQLDKIDKILSKKEYIAQLYRKHLKDIEKENILLSNPQNCVSNNWLITIILESNIMRESLMLYLEANGIETRPVFLPMHAIINLSTFYKIDDMKISEKLSSCGINLPSYPDLKDEQVEFICNKIKEFYEKYNKH